MPVHEIIFVLGGESMPRAIEEWYTLHQDPRSVTRVRLQEQTLTTRKVFCLCCNKVIRAQTAEDWRNHACINVDVIVTIEFRSQQNQVARTQNTLLYLKHHAREGPAYKELWKVLSLVAGLVREDIILIHVARDMFRFDLLDGFGVAALPAWIKRGIVRYGDDAVRRPVPYCSIALRRPSDIIDGAQKWLDILRSTIHPGPDEVPFLQATAIHFKEQEVRASEPEVHYYCIRCDQKIPFRAFETHECKGAVIVTFGPSTGYQSFERSADATDVLSCFAHHSDTDSAVLAMWRILTEHAVQLYERGLVGPELMQDLLESESLCDDVLTAETVARIRQVDDVDDEMDSDSD